MSHHRELPGHGACAGGGTAIVRVSARVLSLPCSNATRECPRSLLMLQGGNTRQIWLLSSWSMRQFSTHSPAASSAGMSTVSTISALYGPHSPEKPAREQASEC